MSQQELISRISYFSDANQADSPKPVASGASTPQEQTASTPINTKTTAKPTQIHGTAQGATTKGSIYQQQPNLLMCSVWISFSTYINSST